MMNAVEIISIVGLALCGLGLLAPTLFELYYQHLDRKQQ
jgi:hypothetical protein